MATTNAPAYPHHKFSLRSTFSFIKVAVISEDGSSIVSDMKRLKFALNNELRLVFGEVGAAKGEFDLLSLTKATKDDAATAILRVQQSAVLVGRIDDVHVNRLEALQTAGAPREPDAAGFGVAPLSVKQGDGFRPISNKQPLMAILGIDLGKATCSAAVILDDESEVQMIHEDPVVALTARDGWVVGSDARCVASAGGGDAVWDLLELLGRRVSDFTVGQLASWPFRIVRGTAGKALVELQVQPKAIPINTQTGFSPEELLAVFLAHMRRLAEQCSSSVIEHVVLTTPANCSYAQRQALRDASAMAGMAVQRFIVSSTAAALAFGLQQVTVAATTTETTGTATPAQLLLVVDVGAASVDVSLVAVKGKHTIEVKAVAGESSLGGGTLTDRIVCHFLRESGIQATQKTLRRLRRASQLAKNILSSSETAVVQLLLDTGPFAGKITRSQFEAACSDCWDRLRACVEIVLRDARVVKEQVDGVLLCGGSVVIPAVQKTVQDLFPGKPMSVLASSDLAARGAATLGIALSTVPPTVQLIDVLPLALGVQRVGGKDVVVVAPANVAVPLHLENILFAHCQNTELIYRVLEGRDLRRLGMPSSTSNASSKTHCINLIRVPKATLAATAVPTQLVTKLQIAFDVDRDLQLTATIVELATLHSAQKTFLGDETVLPRDTIDRVKKQLDAQFGGHRAAQSDDAMTGNCTEVENGTSNEANENNEACISSPAEALQQYALELRTMADACKLQIPLPDNEKENLSSKVEETLAWLCESTTQQTSTGGELAATIPPQSIDHGAIKARLQSLRRLHFSIAASRAIAQLRETENDTALEKETSPPFQVRNRRQAVDISTTKYEHPTLNSRRRYWEIYSPCATYRQLSGTACCVSHSALQPKKPIGTSQVYQQLNMVSSAPSESATSAVATSPSVPPTATSSTGASIALKIRTLDQKTYPIVISSGASVPQLKEAVATETGVVLARQRLIFRGKVLKNDQNIDAYALEDGHVLHLVVRAEEVETSAHNQAQTQAQTSNQAHSQARAPRNNDEPDPTIGGSQQPGARMIMGATIAVPDDMPMPFLSSVIANFVNSMGTAVEGGGAVGAGGIPGADGIAGGAGGAGGTVDEQQLRQRNREIMRRLRRNRHGTDAAGAASGAPRRRGRDGGEAGGVATEGTTLNNSLGGNMLRQQAEGHLRRLETSLSNTAYELPELPPRQEEGSAEFYQEQARVETQIAQLRGALERFETRLGRLPSALREIGWHARNGQEAPHALVSSTVRTIDALQNVGDSAASIARFARHVFLANSPDIPAPMVRIDNQGMMRASLLFPITGPVGPHTIPGMERIRPQRQQTRGSPSVPDLPGRPTTGGTAAATATTATTNGGSSSAAENSTRGMLHSLYQRVASGLLGSRSSGEDITGSDAATRAQQPPANATTTATENARQSATHQDNDDDGVDHFTITALSGPFQHPIFPLSFSGGSMFPPVDDQGRRPEWDVAALWQRLARDLRAATVFGILGGNPVCLYELMRSLATIFISGAYTPPLTSTPIRTWARRFLIEVRRVLGEQTTPTQLLELTPDRDSTRFIDELTRPLDPFMPELVDHIRRSSSASQGDVFGQSCTEFLRNMATQLVSRVRTYVNDEESTDTRTKRLLEAILVALDVEATLAAFVVAKLLEFATPRAARRPRDEAENTGSVVAGPAAKRHRQE